MISVILNTLNRGDLTPKIIEENINNCGIDRKDLQIIINDNGSDDRKIIDWVIDYADVPILQDENIGNPQGLNLMMQKVRGKYVALLGNDIRMTKGWLKAAVSVIDDFNHAGIIGFDWQRLGYETVRIHGHDVVIKQPIFGSWVFPYLLYSDIGYFSEFSKYGIWDRDYCLRATLAGWGCYMLCDYPSYHEGVQDHDTGSYRAMKNRELKKASKAYNKRANQYSQKKYYITRNQKLIGKY